MLEALKEIAEAMAGPVLAGVFLRWAWLILTGQ